MRIASLRCRYSSGSSPGGFRSCVCAADAGDAAYSAARSTVGTARCASLCAACDSGVTHQMGTEPAASALASNRHAVKIICVTADRLLVRGSSNRTPARQQRAQAHAPWPSEPVSVPTTLQRWDAPRPRARDVARREGRCAAAGRGEAGGVGQPSRRALRGARRLIGAAGAHARRCGARHGAWRQAGKA